MPRFRVVLRLLAVATLALVPVAAFAATADVQVLLDTDNNSSTGCNFVTPAGVFTGVEHVLTTAIQADASSGTVQRVTRQQCEGGVLGSPIDVDPGGWAVGVESGTGDALVETRIPLSVIDQLPMNTRWIFVISSAGTAYAVVHDASDHDIFFPTPLRRRSYDPGAGSSPRTFILDGIGTDWTGILPLVTDPLSTGTSAFRILRVFAFPDDTFLWLRFDLRPDGSSPTGPNSPTANPDTFVVRQGRTTVILPPGVLANDTDPNNKPLSAFLAGPPKHGTLTLQPDGGFTYVNDGVLTPSDDFTYRASNGTSSSGATTVTLTITPNHSPTANPDVYPVAHGGSLNIPPRGVLTNDTDPDPGDVLTAVLVNGPTHAAPGSFLLRSNGSFTYTHDGTNTLTDSFTYRASDGISTSFQTTVTITIGPDQPPVANNDGPYTVAEGGTLNVPVPGVLGNDTDPDTPASGLRAQVVTNPTNGTLTLNQNGSFTYVHNGSETTSDSFTYRTSDQILTSNTATVTITITPVNDPPVANADSYSVLEDQPLNVVAPGVLGNDSDPEGSGLTASVVTNVTNGVLNLNANGGFSYQPNANFNGTDTFTYAASDGSASSNATVTITVTPVNDAPSFSNIGNVTVAEDAGPQSIAWASSISAGPPDESGQTLSFVITNVTNSGIFSTQPSISASGVLTFQGAANANGTATVTVHLHDSGGVANGGVDNSADVVFDIIITAVNDPPVLTAGATLNYTENDPATAIDTTLTVSDVDSAQLQSATVTISGNFASGQDVLALPAPVGAITGIYNPGTGVLTLSGVDTLANYQTALRSVTYANTSDNPSTASRTISWVGTDSGGASSTPVTSTVNVSAVNDAPVVTTSGNLSFTENQGPTAIDTGITVTDPDNANLTGATVAITANFVSGEDVLAFAGLGAISGIYNSGTGVLTLSGTDTVANYQAALRAVTYDNTSENPSNAVRQITWTATDGALSSAPATNNVTVIPVNDAPVVTAGGTVSFTENGSPVAIAPSLTVTDADNANLTGATISITGNFASGQDVLAFTPVGSIVGIYNPGTGVLALSGSDTVANYQTALRSVTYSNSSDNPSTAQRTVSFVATDGTDPSAPSTTAVNVIAVNDPPVVTAGGTLSYTENQAATAIDTGLTVSDVDSVNLTGATVSITGGFASSEDVLALPAPVGAINGIYNSGTGVLTLSGTDTVANYQLALRSVTYFNSSDNPSTASRTITWVADDGAATSTPVTSTVNVSAVNDAPTVTPSTNLSYTEGQGAVTLDAGVTVTDPDSTQLTSATVQITGNFASAEDVLALPAPVGSITGAFSSGTGTLTLSGTDTLANYQAALRTVTYTNTSNAPSTLTRTVTWNATDTGAATGAGLTSTITVASVNTPPTVTAGNTINYTENDAATILAPALTVTDPDSATLASATISITTGFQSSEDVLSFTTNGTITGIYNSGSGVLSLSGTDTVANYQSVLRTVRYFNSSDNPSTTSRTIVWVVNDGTDSSAPANTTVNISAVNDAPVLTVAPTASYTEDAPAVTLDSAMTVTDPDSPNLTGATVAITTNFNSTEDVLSATPSGGIGVSYSSGTGVLTLSGTASVAAYQTVLRSVTYQNTSQNPSTLARTITWTATDGTTPGNTTSTVTVTSVNDAPVVTAGATLNYTENQAATVIDNTITVSDVDSANATGATVSITAGFQSGADVLSFATIGPISGIYAPATGILTLSGTDTIANYQAALRTVKYQNTSDNPTATPRTISWVVTDGTTPSAPATSTVNVTPVNDPPVLTVAPTASYTEDAAPVTLDAAMTVTDPDNVNLTGATVAITSNFNSGQDVLSATGVGSITVGYNSLTGVLTLSGTDTVANYQTVLRSVTYQNTSQNPSSLTRTITWTANDGAASGSTTSTVTVTNVNDAPIVTAGGTLNYTENQAATVIDNTITVTDVDSANATGATVSITAGFQSGADVLSFATIGPISGIYAPATGILTLSGTDTMANYQAALRTVKYNNTSEGPTATPRTISWVVTDGTTPSAPATSTVNVTPVNDPPVLTVGGTLNYTEDQAPQALNSSLTVTDADSTNLTGATVSITTNFNNTQDILSFTPSGAVTGLYNSVTGVLTLSGTDTVATYQTVLRSVSYNNTSQNPSTAPRTVVWTATDGTDTSTPANSTINVTSVNDAPVVTAGGTLAYTEQAAATVIDNTVTVTDVDSANAQGATVTISAGFQSGADVLSFATIGPISGIYNGVTGVLTLSGTDTIANYQAALRTVKFNNTSDNPTTPRTISWVVTDSGGAPSAAATSTINITAVNDAPAWIVPGAKTFNEDTPFTFSGADRIRISDADSGANNISVTINTTHGNINVPGGGVTVTGNNSHSVSISGTATNIDTAINNLVYTPDSNYNGADTINLHADDGGFTGTGGAQTADASIGITLNAVNDKPVYAGAPKTLTVQAHMKFVGATGLLTGVTDPDAGDTGFSPQTLQVDPSTINLTGCTGCIVTVTDVNTGTYDFEPPPGVGNGSTVSFTYTVKDNGNPAPGVNSDPITVTVTVNGPVIWFVNQTTGSDANNGTLAHPFQTLNKADTVDAANHRIFLFGGTYLTGITLNSGEWLTGQAATVGFDTMMGISPPAGTIARPTTGLAAPIVPGVTTGANSVLRGFDSSGTVTVNTTGVTASDMNISSGAATALSMNGGGGTLTFGTITSTGGTSNIFMNNATGTISATGGALSGSTAAGAGIKIDGGSASLTFPGSITATAAGGRLVDIGATTGITGGTINLSGALGGAGSAAGLGVRIQNGTGGTINFSGSQNFGTNGNRMTTTAVTVASNAGTSVNFNGTGLVIFTSGAAATGVSVSTGSVAITGANNTIATTSGTAVSVATNTGSMTFKSVDISALAAKGVSVNGLTGSFSITGTAAPAASVTTGGTITGGGSATRGVELIGVTAGASLSHMTFTNAAQSDGANPAVGSGTCGALDAGGSNTGCNAAIHLQSFTGATLSNILVSGSAQMGINGSSVSNLSMTSVEVTGAGTQSGENAVEMYNLSGNCSITSANIHNNFYQGLFVQNNTGTLSSLNVLSSAISNNGAQGIVLNPLSPAVMTAGVGDGTVGNQNTFTSNFSNAIQTLSGGGGLASLNVTVNRNTFTGNNSAVVLQATGGTTTYNVVNNTATSGGLTTGSCMYCLASSTSGGFDGTLNGTLNSNTIGTNGVDNSGSNCAGCSGISINVNNGSHQTATIAGNTIQGIANTAISITGNGSSKGNYTITGNLMRSPNSAGAGGAAEAMAIQSGSLSSDTNCVTATIGGSNATAAPTTVAGAKNVTQGTWGGKASGSSVFVWRKVLSGSTPVFNLPGLGANPVDTFIDGNNTLSGATLAARVTVFGSGYTGAASCP